MAGYWPPSFFCEFIDHDSVSVHKHAKKIGQNSAILISHLVNNPYILEIYYAHMENVKEYRTVQTPI